MDTFISVMLYVALAWMMYRVSWHAFYSKYRRNRTLAWSAMLLIPSVAAALRGDTGTDSLMYRTFYEDMSSIQRWQTFEPGYTFLMKLLNHFHASYKILFFIMMFFTVLFVMLLLQNERSYINVQVSALVFMLSLYLAGFNIMRQALAMAMLLYAMSIFIDGKTWQSVGVILLAVLFHRSALVGLAIIAGKHIFLGKYWKEVLAVGCAVLIYLITHRELLGELVYILTRSAYYAAYVTRDSESASSLPVYVLKICFVVIMGFLYREYYVGEARRMKVYYAMIVCGYTFTALNLITMTYVGRLGEYFSYLYIVLMGFCAGHNLTIAGKTIKKQYISALIILYFLAIFLHQNVYKSYSELIPYQGWFRIK